MKLGILHLSDIHVKNADDAILGKAQLIAGAVFENARSCDLNLVLVSGDIAYSGLGAQYNLAYSFFNAIRESLKRETNRDVDVIVAPGNHDCDLGSPNDVRAMVIDSIISKPANAESRDVQSTCTAVQQEFFKFRKELTAAAPVYDSPLWADYELIFDKKTIRISAINAAWMSRIREKQGELIFPIQLFSDELKKPADFRIALIHHPLNWYGQSTYHPFRKELRSTFDAVLSGHEHTASSCQINDSSEGSSLHFEAPALQPHEVGAVSMFQFLQLDFKQESVLESRYKIVGTSWDCESENNHQLFSSGVGRRGSCDLSPKIIQEFMDAGGNFVHPVKNKIESSDIFVFPELEDRLADSKKSILADQIEILSEDTKRILILGDEKAGKTFLLRRYFLCSRDEGLFPLYLKANQVGSVSESGLDRIVRNTAADQYVCSKEFHGAPRSKRIVFVDDLDRLPGKAKNKLDLLGYLERHFNSIVLSASTSMEITEIVDRDVSEMLSEYHAYEMKNFGHQSRLKLIKKWCECDDPKTLVELDQKVHKIESLINAIIGKNLIPSRPIYLLILLQSCESHQQSDLENSSFAAYYQYLIAKSLQEAGVKKDQLNELFNYLSNLAWLYKKERRKEIDKNSLRDFNKEFSERFTTVDFESRLQALCEAKILSKSGDYYSFLYPYVYYYFVGKYLAANMQDEKIKAMVEGLCKRLDKREDANIVLFLSHHVNDSWLIDQIADTLNGCFEEAREIELNGDIAALNKLVNSSVELMISDVNVEESQQRQRKINDEMEVSESSYEDEQKPEDDTAMALDFTSKFNLMIKTAEILGQVVKNYYGSIERSQKREYLSDVFAAPLRLVRSIFEVVFQDPELFVKEVEKNLKAKVQDLSEGDFKVAAMKVAFSLLGMFCTGVIVRTAQFVSSDNLQEDLMNVVSSNPTNARRLIGAAIALTRPGKLPFSDLKELSLTFKDNTFAFNIFQSLVAYHIHMFHTTESDKQKLCDMAKITMVSARGLDLKGRNSKLISTGGRA